MNNDAIGKLIEEPYLRFNATAKSMYTDETAIASCTATLFIRYSDLCKNNPNFNQLIKTLEAESKQRVQDDVSLNPIKRFIESRYEPLIRAYPRTKMYIDARLENVTLDNLDRFHEELMDWFARNGLAVDFIANIRPIPDEDRNQE